MLGKRAFRRGLTRHVHLGLSAESVAKTWSGPTKEARRARFVGSGRVSGTRISIRKMVGRRLLGTALTVAAGYAIERGASKLASRLSARFGGSQKGHAFRGNQYVKVGSFGRSRGRSRRGRR
jgi:hypothetical protein